MCDTIVVLASATSDGCVIFGKNSDREPNEAQAVEYYPRSRRGGHVKCTYIAIPDVDETRSVLISRPYWMWGAEIGVNEDGVAIGNEAVFTNLPRENDGLIGMDLLRLGPVRSLVRREQGKDGGFLRSVMAIEGSFRGQQKSKCLSSRRT